MMQMAKMDLNEEDEKLNIETIFWSAMDILSDDDKKLPQVYSHSLIYFLFIFKGNQFLICLQHILSLSLYLIIIIVSYH